MKFIFRCPECRKEFPHSVEQGAPCPFCRIPTLDRKVVKQFFIVDGEGFGFHRTSPYAEPVKGMKKLTRIKNKRAWKDHLKSSEGRYEDAR